MGIANVIDSLIIVKQFVYDEKIVTMQELIAAGQANWSGFENLRVRVSGFSDYFVNLNEPLQDDIIRRTIQKE